MIKEKDETYSPKFWNYKRQVKLWIKFFENFGSENKSKKILDYGTGPGWAIFVGSYMGFDIVGTDVTYRLDKIRKLLGVDKYTTIFTGNRSIYDDKSFDIIICKAVLVYKINTFVKNSVELQRLIKNDGMILVSEPHLKYLKQIDSKNKDILSFERKTFDEELYEKLCSISEKALQ